MSSSYGNSMNEKNVDRQQIDILRPLPLHVRQWSNRVRLSCCQSQNNRESATQGPNPSQAILTPISDPAKATKKETEAMIEPDKDAFRIIMYKVVTAYRGWEWCRHKYIRSIIFYSLFL